MGVKRSDLNFFEKLGFAHSVAKDPIGAWFSYRPTAPVLEDLVHMVPEKFHDRFQEFAYLYDMHGAAMEELRRRAEFFVTLLDGPGSVSAENIEKVGTERLGIRAAVALHLAFEKAEKLYAKMEAMPDEFVQYVFNGMRNGFSLIGKFGLDITNHCSPCERTGVCTCERGDQGPPYAHSCLGGNDALFLLPKKEEWSIPSSFEMALLQAFPPGSEKS